MSVFRIADRYAKSLLVLALEKGALEEVHNDMKLVLGLANDSREFQLLLKNPIVHSSKKQQIIDALIKARTHQISATFIAVLLRKGREIHLLEIAKEFVAKYRKHTGKVLVNIEAPIKISEELRKDFIAKAKSISGKEPILNEKINKDLIGGFKLTIEGRQLDESVKSRLQALRKDLIDQTYISKL